MTDVDVMGSGGSAPHIGPAHHPGRTVFWTTAGLAVAAILGGYLWYEQRVSATAAQTLDRFEALYLRRCDPNAFAPSEQDLRRKLYLDSPTLERAVREQLAALERGAPCEKVFRALHDVDFLAAPSARATIELDPRR